MGNMIPGMQVWYNTDEPPPPKKRKLSDGSSVAGGSLYEKDLEISHLLTEIERMRKTYVPIEDYDKMKYKYQVEKEAKDDALRRLSSIAASKLRNKNPNIADLSDSNRPTKIAEKFSELYDNQWTDAFEGLDKSMDELDKIVFLRDILVKSFKECKAIACENYFEKVQRCIECPIQFTQSGSWQSKSVISGSLKQEIKEFRKSRAMYVVKDIEKVIRGKLRTHSNMNDGIQKYISSCVEITWLMVVQDPPLELSMASSSRFDTRLFKEYTRKGPYVEFVVWPALLLHEGGPLLSKGVAQGYPYRQR